MASNHLIPYHPFLLLPSIFPSIRVFSNKSALCIRWSYYWSFSFSISYSNEYSVLISFGIDWFYFLAVQEIPKSLLQHYSLKSINSLMLSLLYDPTLTSIHDYSKNHGFDGRVISLLFNTISRFVIVFLPSSKCLLISWLQSLFTVILEPRKIKSATVSTLSLSSYHKVVGPDDMILVFWMLVFKPAFLLSSFALNKALFNYYSLSAIRVVSFAYLRLLIFLLAILIPAVSSSPTFHIMYSALRLNKQGDNIQPWGTPFPIWN